MSSIYVEEINAGIGAHGAWKMKLKTAIATGSSDVKPAEVRCDDRCALGKWLHGRNIDPQTRLGMPYKVNKRVHAEFHECAAQVLELALSGEARQANELLEGEFREKSEKVVRALNKWKGELVAAARAA